MFRNKKTYLLIKHLTLCIQSIALLHQRINLFPPFQNALNRLMQHNLGLIQLFLNLHDTICLVRVLVFDNIFLKLREIEFGRRIGECSARILREELVDHFGEELMRDKAGIVRVADDDSGNAFSAAVGMKRVGYFSSSRHERRRRGGGGFL